MYICTSMNTCLFLRSVISIRDFLSWVQFINTLCINDEKRLTDFSPEEAYIHGACLVFIDAIGSGNTAQARNSDIEFIRQNCVSFVTMQVQRRDFEIYGNEFIDDDKQFGIHPFCIPKGKLS